MRLLIITAGAVLALSACSSKTTNTDTTTSTDANMMTTDSNMMDANMTTDANMMGGTGAMDANATGGADANMATNAATENSMKQKDLNTNDRDTNLANGM